jgi:hypothetical protein
VENFFFFFIFPPLGEGAAQATGEGLFNGKLKVESGKLFRFFYFPSLGEGVAQATGEGLLSYVIARG